MIEIKYTTRVFPQKNGAIAIRVRWNHKKNEVEFTTGDWVEPEKWDVSSTYEHGQHHHAASER